jgi:citrate lyase beta subunit
MMQTPPTLAPSASWLFVPASRPERFDKAARAGADEVILDLEDAVSATQKESARDDAARWMDRGGSAWVLVNALGTRWHEDDLTALGGCAGLRGVLVPKAEMPPALSAIARELPAAAAIIALVETADAGVIARDAARARSLGFRGKLCIHPAQVAPVNAAFSSPPADTQWAREVLAAALQHADDVFELDGQMVDKPVLERDARIVARAPGGQPTRDAQ